MTFVSLHLLSQEIVEGNTRIMSRSTISSLESQLSTATHELELATFLNKGILQTNTEYKLRIAELESENNILRKAETRLAGTEDALEDAEKRIKVLEEERDVWEEELETAKENMESAERDKDAAVRERDHERNQRELWEERFWELRGSLEGLVRRTNYQTGESSRALSQAKSKKGLLPQLKDLTPVAKIKPNSSASTGRLSRKPRLQSPTPPPSPPVEPSSPLRRPMREAAKKRKRLAESESDEEDVFVPKGGRRKVLADPLADSNYTEVESASFKSYVVVLIFEKTSSQIATPTSSRVPFSSKRRGRQSNNTTQQVEITMQVKEEPISPGYENRSEDSDDPL
ncbi:hypothetical protein C367_04745 [Cryptococcus neoformans Ze90-1]|nr:hypothetical protein C367_04745 [Cryptococcus neoformans var. grubii Ze90-1]